MGPHAEPENGSTDRCSGEGRHRSEHQHCIQKRVTARVERRCGCKRKGKVQNHREVRTDDSRNYCCPKKVVVAMPFRMHDANRNE